jgi:hypothetical protein
VAIEDDSRRAMELKPVGEAVRLAITQVMDPPGIEARWSHFRLLAAHSVQS